LFVLDKRERPLMPRLPFRALQGGDWLRKSHGLVAPMRRRFGRLYCWLRRLYTDTRAGSSIESRREQENWQWKLSSQNCSRISNREK
jgi:hypothetical protein